jgi:TolB-like protein
VVVPPKVFDAALYFLQHPGQVLSKAELLAELWPGLVVEENSLTQVISLLRSALGEARGENRYLVTVPRRGYCFVATVLHVATMAEIPATHDRTVAVLMFDNWSGLAADHTLAAGIAESIMHRLAGIAGIKVVAQTSSFALRGLPLDAREVGRRLDARYLVEGSLQRAGARLRITAQLIDANDGTHVWSLMFNVKTDDAFTVEDSVSQRVARALRHSLGRVAPQINPGRDRHERKTGTESASWPWYEL